MAKGKWLNLKDIPLPRLLHIISSRCDPASVLDITRGMLKRRIYFKDGCPVHVVSNSMSDVLGRMMLEEGAISQDVYKKSLEIMLNEKKKLGEVLISMGCISQKELFASLTLQMKKKIWRIFGWPDGSYKYFLLKTAIPSNIQLLPLNPLSVIIGGLLNGYYPFEQIEAELRAVMEKRFVVSQNKFYSDGDIGLNLQQERFISRFDGKETIKEAIKNSDLLSREARLLSYALIITNMVCPKDEAVSEQVPHEDALRYETYEERTEEVLKDKEYAASARMDAELLFQNGKIYLENKDYEKAVGAFKEIVKINPNEAEYKAYLGWALFNATPQSVNEAKDHILESLLINPDMDVAYIFLARLYIKEGLLKEAEEVLKTALKKNPFLPEARKELTLIKIRSGAELQKRAYVDHFHLTRDPFDTLPNPYFLYVSDAYTEALYFLSNNIKDRKLNVILLTGDKGSGKTTTCLQLMDKMSAERVVFIYIDFPLQSELNTLITIKNELGVETDTDSADDVLSALRTYFSKYSTMQGRTIIMLDDAHNCSPDAITAVKTLLNAGVDSIVILAQPEIEHTINKPRLKEIKQRITGIHYLHPLSYEETKEYILRRLMLAGGEGIVNITPWAMKTIHNASAGNPEMINKICGDILKLASTKATSVIDEQIVKTAEAALGKEVYERLPQLEPVDEYEEESFDKKTDEIISEQVATMVRDIVQREFEARAAQFNTSSITEEAVERVKGLIREEIAGLVRDIVHDELSTRGAKFNAAPVLNNTAGDDAEKIIEETAGKNRRCTGR